MSAMECFILGMMVAWTPKSRRLGMVGAPGHKIGCLEKSPAKPQLDRTVALRWLVTSRPGAGNAVSATLISEFLSTRVSHKGSRRANAHHPFVAEVARPQIGPIIPASFSASHVLQIVAHVADHNNGRLWPTRFVMSIQFPGRR